MKTRWIPIQLPALLALGLSALALATSRAQIPRFVPERSISIAGDWQFQSDPKDAGLRERWFEKDLPNRLKLPGSLQAQGFGDEISPGTAWTGEIMDRSYFTEDRYAPYRQPGNVKFPFWLTPWKHYVGAVWYHREIIVPRSWKDERITLTLERCHWETSVWVDGQPVGSNDSLGTAHVFDLSRFLAPGTHRLALRVDNRVKIGVGINAHSVTDHTQGNWNGVVGNITLTATDPLHVADIQVHPQLANRSARVVLTLGNDTPRTLPAEVRIRAISTNTAARHIVPDFTARTELQPGLSTLEIVYPLGDKLLTWDEFDPALYQLEVTLRSLSTLWSYADSRRASFGMREFTADGTQFAVNGRKTFLRGTLECAIFPATGYPPTDLDSWKRIIRTCKAHGLNHIRFHSWCPPEAAFAAADELGFYFQVECGSWANSGSTIGDGHPIDHWLVAEADRILRAYGNHPSFAMLAYGNEPAGERQKEFLTRLVTSWKAKDNRRLYTGAAGWPILAANDYQNTPDPRIQAWGQGLKSRINALPPETVTDYRDFVARHKVPVVSHEIGQWCAYPNFDEIGKYNGFFSAGNFEIFRDHLRAKGMGGDAQSFLLASGKLQTLCYKEDIESALRTPGFGGFQLLDLHDFPGQGTALVGVLDAFWDSKGYVSAAEFSRFCGPIVPLVRLPQRVFTANQTLEADVELANFGPAPLQQAAFAWSLVDAKGAARASGMFDPADYPLGNGLKIGHLSVPFGEVQSAEKLTLVVSLGDPGKRGPATLEFITSTVRRAFGGADRIQNDWDIWVYPPAPDNTPGPNVLVADALNDAVFAHLDQGGDLLLMPPPARVAGDVQMGFSSIFWNTAWTRGQPPHTLGVLCDPQHPALAAFPTDSHSNWQWWDLVTTGAATVMDDLPNDLRPIVQVVDDWFKNRKLGLVFEARLSKGRVLYTSLDLRSNIDQRPVARQMLHSLLSYMGTAAFEPNQELTPQHLQVLLK